jgi:hypothetical protein
VLTNSVPTNDSGASGEPEIPVSSPDPFDPSNLAKMKLSKDFATMAAVSGSGVVTD